MYRANAGITSEHPYGSRWWSWPLGHKPVYYWNQDVFTGQPGWTAKIYFLSNPLLWISGAGLALLTLLMIIWNKKSRQKISPVFYILIFAWLANWLPFILISRVAFLYHYLLPSAFATLILALCLARLWPKEKFAFITISSFLAAAFLVFLPYCYGWPLPPAVSRPLSQLVNLFI
jgi:dolichyl-phosphate-mannose--protein O-mannosyl transferase